jgi:hypothetical protein
MDHRARSWVAAALLAAPLLAAGGCAEEEEALIVLHSPAFEQGECTADASTSTILQQGNLDVLYGTAYTLPVVLLNNLRSRPATQTSSGVDDSELQLTGVDVSLSMPQAPEVMRQVADENPAFVHFSAVLPSQSMIGGQEIGVLVEAVPDGTSRALRDAIEELLPEGSRPTLSAELTFHATRTGNSTGSLGVIDARAYTFPIRLCVGCLVATCETCTDGQCPAEAQFAGVCGNAQDGVLVPVGCEAPSS